MTVRTRSLVDASYTLAQLNTDAPPNVPTQVFRLPVDVVAGDVLVGMASQEFTTQENYPSGPNAMTWCDFFLSQDPNAVAGSGVDLYFASRGATNITPAQHHFVFTLNGAVKVPAKGTWYAILVVHWDEDLTMPGRIEQGASYGKLELVRLAAR